MLFTIKVYLSMMFLCYPGILTLSIHPPYVFHPQTPKSGRNSTLHTLLYSEKNMTIVKGPETL